MNQGPKPKHQVPYLLTPLSKSAAQHLASAAVFVGLEPAALNDILAAATPVAVAQNDYVVRQGDPGDALYVILRGSADVLLELDGGAWQIVAHLGAGDCVGEMALLTKRKRSASVVAREPTRALRVAADVIEHVFERHPSAKRHFVAFAARRLPSLRLAATGLFGVDAAALERLDHEANWVRLQAGETLFHQGDAAEEMYVVVHGSLEVIVEQRDGKSRLVDVFGPGASVGEMALLADETRSATVRAVRDSELVRIAKVEFLRLLDEHPRAAVELSRTLVKRLRETTMSPRVTRYARTVALVSAHGSGLPKWFAPHLEEALRDLGDTVLHLSSAVVDAELGADTAQTQFDDVANPRLLNWLNERQDRFRYVVYECDSTLTAWTQRCLRQADIVLAVAHGAGDPVPSAVERERGAARYELVLLHEANTVRPSGTAKWLEARGNVAAHHHIRVDRPADVRRLARSIASASLGVVFSGGGARGFAEIGALRALSEFDLDVDMIGGAGIGAIFAGLHALGHDVPTIVELCKKSFDGFDVGREKSLVKMVKSLLGDAKIEDLWIPYFCVSSNLSRAEVVVHDAGPLWYWVRASSSVPGIVPPVPYRGDLLVDGGLLNNLPADILRARCRGAVLAVDVGAPVELRTAVSEDLDEGGARKRGSLPNNLRILSRAATLSSLHNQGAMRDLADLYIKPPTDGIDPLDWQSIDHIVELGYRDAYNRIAEWRDSDLRVTAMHAAMQRTGAWET